MEHYIGTKFIKEGEEYKIDKIKAHNLVLLFFGAYWSPPCKKVLKPLKSLYEELNDPLEQLEIVFISCDFNQKDFDDYTQEMPWASIPFELLNLREIITRQYEIQGIPSLLHLHNNGSSQVLSLSKEALKEFVETWSKKPDEASYST